MNGLESSEEESSIPEIPSESRPATSAGERQTGVPSTLKLSNGNTVDISILLEGLPLRNLNKEEDKFWSRDFLFDQIRKMI
jgi:hypothetical protein